jgi:methionine-rich copper-binding protein CopC
VVVLLAALRATGLVVVLDGMPAGARGPSTKVVTPMTARSLRAASRTAGTGALLALFVAVAAQPAAAHDQLLDSSPGEGEHLDVAPTEVTLRFSDEILAIGPAVIVADDAGTTWTVGDPVLDGPDVVTELADDVPDGSYELRWRVVSSDGHPITGVIPFSVGDTAPTSGSETGSAAPAGPSDSSAADPAAGSAADPAAGSPGGQPEAAVSAADPAAGPAWVRPVVVGVLGALAASLVFWVAVRPSRRRPAPPDDASL